MKKTFTAVLAGLIIAAGTVAGAAGKIKMENIEFGRHGSKLDLGLDYVLDSVKLKSNHQILVTPVIEDGSGANQTALPTILINGRNMHYVYERGAPP